MTDYSFTNAQSYPHEQLRYRMHRHLQTPWRKPVPEHTQTAFERLRDRLDRHGGPLVLDAGCGTGSSTVALTRHHPDALVVGVDRSAVRLARHREVGESGSSLLLRANLADLWGLMHRHRIKAAKLYVLYPNPYPKRSQLKRRWHGHPVFPLLFESSEAIELRTNWLIYAREFATACELMASHIGCARSIDTGPFNGSEALSLFEQKYWRAGCPTFRVSCVVR